ncbi:MAG TPA: hypothetical protein PKA64_24590, partial [Myxococcota bacterium]|nr:hypothetical protein [Myxococcota bacterium]
MAEPVAAARRTDAPEAGRDVGAADLRLGVGDGEVEDELRERWTQRRDALEDRRAERARRL